jgi:hypothetical protein
MKKDEGTLEKQQQQQQQWEIINLICCGFIDHTQKILSCFLNLLNNDLGQQMYQN